MKTQLTILPSVVGFASELAAIAGWLNRKQLDVTNYLHAENEILKEQLEKQDVKLALSNTQRRKLAKCGKKLGR
ncbi:hypothetical protein QEH59_17305 [Coraliomargarita sp. SDUM461004]|uniref:Uncharacterized protein n=1 Tax=Thalassobacterium sedimentorum TaxID=3041258 RepID=A0ABU1AQN8_9BACT|nr:hypothetical protein [Coraliomargarita sp. SDUM461004]MDQ8196195.1 hypothetical protein [Coraliomargarita sp. SDUM461004]